MWPRIVEVMLGVWLAASPFIFRHDPSQTLLWLTDFAAAFVVVVASLAAYHPPLGGMRFLTAGVGLYLLVSGWLNGAPPSPDPGFQNHLLTGLLLGMMAIIPNDVNEPPEAWKEGEETT